jgi:hypothetical protein
MSGSQIAVAAVWLAFIASALYSGLSMGAATRTLQTNTGEPFPPPNVALIILSFGFIASSVGVFLARRVIRYGHSWKTRWIDWAWGQGTWETIVVRLRPVALLMVTASITGFVGLISTYTNSQSWTAYVNSAFALSVGVGLIIAYCLSRRFPPALF